LLQKKDVNESTLSNGAYVSSGRMAMRTTLKLRIITEVFLIWSENDEAQNLGRYWTADYPCQTYWRKHST